MKLAATLFIATLTLISCGSDKSSRKRDEAPHDRNRNGDGPGSSAKLDETSVEMQPADPFFRLTAPMTQWKLNSIVWNNAKDKLNGTAAYDNVLLLPPPGQPNYARYELNWLAMRNEGCEVADKTKARFYLDSIKDFKVQETRELPFGEGLSVDPSQTSYNLRVHVENHGNCANIKLEVGILAKRS